MPSDALLAGLHLKHDYFHRVAHLHHLRRMLQAARPRHFRNMNQAFNAGFQFHEGAVIGDTDHAPDDAQAHTG